jgi:lipid-binding SYLF domain-containing protein
LALGAAGRHLVGQFRSGAFFAGQGEEFIRVWTISRPGGMVAFEVNGMIEIFMRIAAVAMLVAVPVAFGAAISLLLGRLGRGR